MLTLKSLGIDDVINFDYMDHPDIIQLEESLKHLFFLDAISFSGKLTRIGEELSKFPLDPSFGKALMLAYHID